MRLPPWAARVIIIVCWLAAWEITALYILRDPAHASLVATPDQAFIALAKMIQGTDPMQIAMLKLHPPQSIPGNFLLTFYEIGAAFFIAAGVGLSTGMLIGQSRLLEESLEPLVLAILSVPNYVLYPIFYLLFGLGPTSYVAFGSLLGFFPVFANTVSSSRSVDPQMVALSKTMGASGLKIFQKVVMPASAGPIATGLKQGFSLSIIGVVAGQLLYAASGIGYLLTYAAGFFYPAELEAMVLVAVMVAIAGNLAFSQIERRFAQS